MAACLNVLVTSQDFTFTVPQGQRLTVTDGASAQLEKLVGQRFRLSDSLARKVAEDQAHQETSKGWWCWCCYGCVGSTFDLDRDLGLLRQEVAAAIAANTLLQPQQFALVEHVEEGRWRSGRALLRLQLEAAAAPDPAVNTALPYEYPHLLKGTA